LNRNTVLGMDGPCGGHPATVKNALRGAKMTEMLHTIISSDLQTWAEMLLINSCMTLGWLLLLFVDRMDA
jgi:hypothetical protein